MDSDWEYLLFQYPESINHLCIRLRNNMLYFWDTTLFLDNCNLFITYISIKKYWIIRKMQTNNGFKSNNYI